jgi:RND superfamily putative drug exporter
VEAPLREERSEKWARWAQGVAAHPWTSLAAGAAILLVLALPLRHLHLGQSDVGKLPESTTARQAYDRMSEAFGPGSNGPLLVTGVSEIPKTPGVQSATQTAPGLITVVPTTAPSDRATEDLVKRLRAELPPHAYVGGQTAGYIDLAQRISDSLPRMVAIVCLLSMIVLALAFRSILIPVKAALMNLLSVAAAYGVLTFAFDPIVSFVPLLMFAILFGLSMDYEVFLLTEMREHHRRDGRAVHAVIEGLADTGRVITSAALIMVCVFTSFVLNGDPVVKQFGVGLAAAIAIDATIVRCLLVPAVMTLLGDAAWWMPKRIRAGRRRARA